jgi:hypothetical protein
LAPTLEAAREASIELPEHASVHLDRAYDSKVTRWLLQRQGLVGVISQKGKPAPLTAGLRWVVERTNSWHNAHNKLVWCTEREEPVIDFWIAFSNVVIIGVQTHPGSLDPLSSGGATCSPTLTYWRKL